MTKFTAHPHQLQSPDAIKAFAFAGNSTFTVVSKRTGVRFTYRVRASEDKSVYFVGVLAGPDNETSYSYMGIVRGNAYQRTRKSRVLPDAPSAKVWDWFFTVQLFADTLHPQLEVWHEGRCGMCNRKLTVPSSIERGIGPDCATRMSQTTLEKEYAPSRQGGLAKAVRGHANYGT